MSKSKITKSDIQSLANLSNLNLSDDLIKEIQPQFQNTLKMVSQIQSLDTKGLKQTNQVTGLTNVFREDKIEKDRVLTQKEALQNAKNTHKGYFVVDQLIDN